MKTLRLVVDLEYDDESMHGDDPDSIKWFMEELLLGKAEYSESLLLHSDEIGDTIGEVTVISVEEQS